MSIGCPRRKPLPSLASASSLHSNCGPLSLLLMQCAWCAALNSPEGNAASTADPAAPRLMLKQVHGSWIPPRIAGRVVCPNSEPDYWFCMCTHTSQVAQRRRLTPSTVAGYVLIAIVVVLVGSIFVLASSLVMPALFSPLTLAAVHLPIAALLVINILL
jgi:hypothetical protein